MINTIKSHSGLCIHFSESSVVESVANKITYNKILQYYKLNNKIKYNVKILKFNLNTWN